MSLKSPIWGQTVVPIVLKSMGDTWRSMLKTQQTQVLWLLMRKCLQNMKEHTLTTAFFFFIPQMIDRACNTIIKCGRSDEIALTPQTAALTGAFPAHIWGEDERNQLETYSLNCGLSFSGGIRTMYCRPVGLKCVCLCISHWLQYRMSPHSGPKVRFSDVKTLWPFLHLRFLVNTCSRNCCVQERPPVCSHSCMWSQ